MDLSSATLDFVSLMFFNNISLSLFKSTDFKISKIASAPIPAVKASSHQILLDIYLIHLRLKVDFF